MKQLQIELTTRCNFDCFYCAGRQMQQKDMHWDTFVSIVNRYIERYGKPTIVNLQGEGEPTLHPDFFKMAQWIVDQGIEVYSITNGTYRYPEKFIGLFSKLGVSLDTLDEDKARLIGRYKLPKVLDFINEVGKHLKVCIHSIEDGKNTQEISKWCTQHGHIHAVQPLQEKDDYAKNYNIPRHIPTVGFACGFLSSNRLRYFTVDGIELPCCHIKDISVYPGLDELISVNTGKSWPLCCSGCRYGYSIPEPHQHGTGLTGALSIPIKTI